MLSSPVDRVTPTLFTAATIVPASGTSRQLAIVRTLLDDIATYTGRPLASPAASPRDRFDEYTVVWFNHDYDAASPRQAAEHSWQWMRWPDSQACVFHVVNRRTGARVEVDLLGDEPATDADPGSPS